MLFRRVSISIAAVLLATAAMAQGGTSHNKTDMFRGPRLDQTIANGAQDHSKDAILPDGTINLDLTTTGSVTDQNSGTNFSQPRLQCDASPNTSEMRSNTFDMPLSGCP